MLRKPPRLHEIMGSRYVLCAPNDKPYDPAATPRFAVNGYTIFENPAYMGRVTFVHSLAGTFSSETQFISRVSRGFDFRRAVCLPDADAKSLKPFLDTKASAMVADDDRLNLVKNSVDRVLVQLECSRPGVVILNEWSSFGLACPGR